MAVAASAEHVYPAISTVTAGEIPLMGLLFWLRALPARLAGRTILAFRGDGSFLAQAIGPGGGFLLLEEAAGRELVIGTVGQFWKPLGGSYPALADSEEFLAFAFPNSAKAVLGFRIVPGETGGSNLITETRIQALGLGARRRFALYWVLIRPGSGLLRRLWLRAIRRRAEREVRGSPSATASPPPQETRRPGR